METLIVLQVILGGLCVIGVFVVLIFVLRNAADEDTVASYYELIRKLNEQEKEDLKIITDGNKEIDKIEKRTLECKKKLGMKKFK